MKTGLVILASLIFVDRETFRDAQLGNDRHWNRFLIRLIVPVLVGLITWSWLLGALAFSCFYLVFDPLLNLRRGKLIFNTDGGTWKQVLSGEKSFYDVIDGRVALVIETIIFVYLLIQNFKQ